MSLQFEWDNQKAAMNLKKHGVKFEEARTVFYNPLACIFDDERHSVSEQREIIIGHSQRNQLLIVCFTERAKGVIRIFRKAYEITSHFLLPLDWQIQRA